MPFIRNNTTHKPTPRLQAHVRDVHPWRALWLVGVFALLSVGLISLPIFQPVDFDTTYHVRQIRLVAGESAAQVSPKSCEGWSNASQALAIDALGSAQLSDFTADNTAWLTNGPEQGEGLLLANGEAWLTCGDFSFAEDIPSDAVDVDATLFLSFAADTYEGNEDIVVFAYSKDGGSNWTPVDSFALLEDKSNAEHEGYWAYTIPDFHEVNSPEDFMVRVRYVAEPPTQNATAYVDGVRLELSYKREARDTVRLGEYVKTPQKVFRGDEEAVIEVQTEKKSALGFLGVRPTVQEIISTTLITPDGQSFRPEDTTAFQDTAQGQVTQLRLSTDNFRTPGRYTLSIELRQDEVTQTVEKAFDWGVVVVDHGRATYLKGELAQLSLGFLDADGRTVCNADIQAEIHTPSGALQQVSLDDGITRSNDCSPDIATSAADYVAAFLLEETGEYSVTITAASYAGKYVTQTTVEAVENTNLAFYRIAPTRLVPSQEFDVFLEFVPGATYSGTVSEALPDGADIVQINQGGVQIGNSILWDVQWQSGQAFTLSYRMRAPESSPEMLLLGPASTPGFFAVKNNVRDVAAWRELQAWQLHVDEYTRETPIFLPLSSSDDLLFEAAEEIVAADASPIIQLKPRNPVAPEERKTTSSTVLVEAITLRTPLGEELVTDPAEVVNAEGELEFRFTDTDFQRPGKYEVELTTTALGEEKTFTDEFYWGVVAVNVRQSLAPTHRSQKVHLSVVDDLGRTVCDARVDVTITAPDGTTDDFHTSDGTITPNPDCVDKSVTNDPDYWLEYTGALEGEYGIQVRAVIDDGSREITDHFNLAEAVPYEVTRTAFPTRIYPPAPYPVTLTLRSAEAFQGTIREEVPGDFAISSISDGGILGEDVEGRRSIIWTVNWTAGQEYTLGYEFDAPNVSPYFYELGKLQMLRNDGTQAFTELRHWQIAADATKTWDGGHASSPNWSSCENWNNDTCPVAADDIIFDGTSNDNSTWDSFLFASSVSSITVTSMSGTLTITKTPVTITGDFTHTSTGAVTYATSGSISIGGNYTMTTSGTFTESTSTVTMTGTSNTLNTTKQHYNLTIDPSSAGTITANTNDFNVTNTLVVQTNDTLSLSSDVFLSLTRTSGDALTINGTISGSGWLSYATTTDFPTSGTLSANLRIDDSSGNIRLSGRTYGGSVEVYNSSSTTRTMTLANGSSQTVTVNGDFLVNAAGTANQSVLGTTFNPTVNISGDLLYTGAGSGSESIATGTGTWTVGGDINFTGGTFIAASTNTFVMSGTNNTIIGDGRSFRHLTIDPSSAGTITMSTSDFTVAGVLTVASGDTLSIDSGRIAYLSGTTGTTLSLDGTISGAGILRYRTSTAFPTTGTISAKLQLYTLAGGADMTLPARTYGGDVEYLHVSTGSNTFTLGTAGSQTITINGTFLITASSSGVVSVDGATQNPTMVIGGSLDKGTGTQNISTGTGTWSIGATLDLRGGGTTTIASGNTITMTGASGDVWLNGASPYNFTIDSSSGSTITINDGVVISNTLTVETGDDAHFVSGTPYFDLPKTSGTSLVLNGTISGDGFLYYYSSEAFPSTGTVTAPVYFYPLTVDQTISGRTFGNDVIIEADNTVLHTVTFGTGASQTITISGDLNVSAISSANVEVDAETNDPAVVVGGDLDFTGTGGGTEVLKVGAGTWTVSGNVNLTSGQYSFETGSTLTMNGSSKTLTTDSNTLHNLTLSGTITLASATHQVNGNLDMTGGTVTATGSTVVMNGTSKAIIGGGNTLGNLTVDSVSGGTITVQTSDLTVSGTLDVDTNDTLSIDASRTLTHSGSTLTLDGIISGSGLLSYQSSSAFPTSGTISARLRFDASNTDQNMSARTYGNDVEIYSTSGFTPRTVTMGSGTHTISGNLTMAAAGIAGLTLEGDANNPTVNVSGNIDFTGAGAGTETVQPGTGTWTVSGSVDFRDGTYQVDTTANMVMNGTAVTLSGGGNSLYNLNVDPSSAGTVTVQDSDLTVTNGLTVASGDVLSIGSGRVLTWTGSSFTLDGTISGAGRFDVATTTTIPTTGTLSSVVRFDTSTAGNMTMPARTYGGNVEAYTANATFTSNEVTMGSGTHTISGSVTVTVDNNQIVTLTGSGNNPTVGIGGDLSYSGGGASDGQIITGTGTWTVSGNVNFTGGNTSITAGNTLQMNGTSKSITSAGEALQNFAVTGGSVSSADAMDVDGTFSVTSEGFTADTDTDLHIAGDFTLANSTTFTGPTGGGTVIFDGDLTFTDNNATKQNMGDVQVGASPDTVDLASDFSANSLVVTVGNVFNTNGYDLDINSGGFSSGIVISGTFDATDDVETDETTINNADSFTINSTATFTADQSTLIMDGASGTKDLITDGSFSLYNLTLNDGGGSLTVEVEDPIDITNDLDVSGGTLSILSGQTVSLTKTSGASLVLVDTISGDGKLVHFSSTELPDTGMLLSPVRIDVTGSDHLNLATRSNSGGYGSDLEIYSNKAATDAMNFSAGALSVGGDFSLEAVGGGNLQVSFTTHNNNITVAGAFTIVSGGSSESIFPGTGTWNHGGDLNISGFGFNIDDASLFRFNGAGAQVLTCDGCTFTGSDNFGNVEIASGGTVSLAAGDNFDANGNMTLTSGTFDSNGNNVLVGGNWDNNGTTYTPNGSTVTFDATDTNNTVEAGASAFYNLTFSGVSGGNGTWTVQTDDLSVANVLSVDTGDTLSIASGRIVTLTKTSGSVLTLNGTIGGAGTLVYSTTTTFPTSGTLSSRLRFDASAGNQSIPARTYGGDVEIYNNSAASARTVTLGTAGSQTLTFSGDLTLEAANTQNISLSGATHNPAIAITGDLGFTGAGAGSEAITTGTGAWTIGGNVDFSNGSFTATSGNTVTLNGSGTQTVTANSQSFYDLSLTNSSGAYSGCSTSFTPGIAFADNLTVSNTYAITTNNVKVEYNSGSTYTFTNINWAASSGNDIIFRNSDLNAGTWLLDVSGTQTAVSYVNVGRSDASAGDEIDASDGTNTDCNNNTHWAFLTPADFTWLGTTDANWNTGANWQGGVVPGSGNTAIFISAYSNPCNINTNANVAGIDIQSGYSSTITQNTGQTLTIGGAGYSQASGTFLGGDSAIDINNNSDFTLTGGVFIASSGTMYVGRHWTHTAGGIFDNNNGTVEFDWGFSTIDVNTSEAFHHLTFNKVNNTQLITVASGDSLVVDGTFTWTLGKVLGGTIDANGDVVVGAGNANVRSDSTLTLTGSATQSCILNGGSVIDSLVINNASATCTVTGSTLTSFLNITVTAGVFNGGSFTIDVSKDITISGGMFIATSGTMFIQEDWTHTAGGIFDNNDGTVEFDYGWSTIDVNTSEAFHHLTFNKVNNTQVITIPSDDTLIVDGAFTWTLGKINSGTVDAKGDVTVGPANASISSTSMLMLTGAGVQTCTLNGGARLDNFTVNNASATCTSAGSGTVTVGGNLNLTAGKLELEGHNLTISGTTFAIGASGIFQLQGGETLSQVPDTNTGTVVYDGSTGPYTVKNWTYTHLTVDGTGTFNLGAAETVSGVFTASAGTFDASDFTFAIDGNTVIDGGIVKTGTNAVTFGNGAPDTVTMSSGELQIESDATDTDITVNAGTWTNSGGTITYLGESSTTIFNAIDPYYHLTLNATGETFTSNGTIDINGDLSITAGTLDLDTNDNDLSLAGNWTNNGTFASGSGAVTFNGSGTQVLTTGGTGAGQDFQSLLYSGTGTLQPAVNDIVVNGTLTINSDGGTLDNTTNDRSFTVLGDISISDTVGGFTWSKGDGTLTLVGTTDQDLSFLDKAVEDIVLNKSSGTVTLLDGVTTDSLTVTDGALDMNGQTFAFAAAGDVVNDDLIRLIGSETVTNVTSWDSDSGTVEFYGDGIGAATTHTIPAPSFFHLSINDQAASNRDTFQVDSDGEVAGDLTLTSGILDITSGTTLTHAGTILTLGDSIIGDGRFVYTSALAFPTTGTISSMLRMDASDNDQVLAARTYGGDVEAYSGSSGAGRTLTLATASGQTLSLNGDLLVRAEGSQGMLVSGASNNPDIDLAGSLDFIGIGAGSESLITGTGDWNIAGDIDVGVGTLTAQSGNTVILDGNTQQTISGNPSFFNLTLTNSSGAVTGCSNTFTPGLTFLDNVSATGTYTITTPGVNVEYHTGSTYTFTNIEWTGSEAEPLTFRNSDLNAGTWLLDVSGTQTDVSYVDVARSDASAGDEIDASNGTNTNCGTTTNWNFSAADTTPAIFTDITATPGVTSVVITWTSNEPTTTLVRYGLSDAYGLQTTEDTDMVTEHEASISGLASATTYHYQVVGTDAGSNVTESEDDTFTTESLPATVITNVQVEVTSSTSATVTWDTNHPADSKVRYGTTTDYGLEVYSPALVTEHEIVLTDLQPATTYHYEVLSTGNTTAIDADATFTTEAASSEEPEEEPTPDPEEESDEETPAPTPSTPVTPAPSAGTDTPSETPAVESPAPPTSEEEPEAPASPEPPAGEAPDAPSTNTNTNPETPTETPEESPASPTSGPRTALISFGVLLALIFGLWLWRSRMR